MARILVAGGVNRDRVIRVDGRLGGTRLRGEDLGSFVGGAGANTGRALALGGHAVTLAAAVGRGSMGDAMLGELAARGIEVGRVARPDLPVSEPLILIDEAAERTIIQLGRPDGRSTVDHEAFDGPWDAIYAAAPGEGLRRLCDRHLGRCPILGQWYAGRPVPVCDVALASDQAQGAVALPASGPAWLVLTHGLSGATALGRDGMRLRRPAAAAPQMRDTTGAGDVYAAGLLHGMLAGQPMGRAMELAAAVAALQVGVLGPAPPTAIADVFAAWDGVGAPPPGPDGTRAARPAEEKTGFRTMGGSTAGPGTTA